MEFQAASLKEVKARIRSLFTQERVAVSAGHFLDELLNDDIRKTGWARGKAAGDPGPWRQQAILGRGHWDADALRDIVRTYAVQQLASEDAVLVIDETAFIKQGKATCGVARQFDGGSNKISNCQIGIFAAYVSRQGLALIDRALYLPKEWTNDAVRMTAAQVPMESPFTTKAASAVKMIDRVLAVNVPFSWVAASIDYGAGDVEGALRRAGKGYVLAVSGKHHFNLRLNNGAVGGSAEEIARGFAPSEWQILTPNEGIHRHQIYAWIYREIADVGASEYQMERSGLWTSGLLVRRNLRGGELEFFTTWCPAGTGMRKLATVDGYRQAVERSFEIAKSKLGLDHNETRSWHGWHRHVSLVMLAFAALSAARAMRHSAQISKTHRGPND